MGKEDREKKRLERQANRKPFGETGLGKFLKGAGSVIGGTLGDVLPDKGLLGIVKSLIHKDDNLSEEDKEIALKMLEKDLTEMQEITKRWVADSKSDSWMSKNIRPLVVANFTLLIDFVIIASQFGKPLNEAYLPILMTMGITAIGGYFTLREFGKTKK